MSSSIRTRNIKNDIAMGGYLITFTLTTRINRGCNILEIPILKSDLVEHKVLITDGETSTNGIIIQPGYIYFITDTPIFYTPGAQIYVLNERYKQYALTWIYPKYKKTLTDVLFYIAKIEDASLTITMSFDVDYYTVAGTPEASDVLETYLVQKLSESLDIDPKRVVVTRISPGSVVVVFMILESIDNTGQTSIDIGEEIKFQLSKQNSKLYESDLFRKAKSIQISVDIKDLAVTDPEYIFLRNYNINIYEKIVNEEIDVLGDLFEFLNVVIE